MLKITTYPLGPIQTNCYIIQDEMKNCLIIDPGEEGSRIISESKKRRLKPLAILLTHGISIILVQLILCEMNLKFRFIFMNMKKIR